MRDSRNGLVRPESEWVRCEVEPIIDEATFDAARRLRGKRNPKSDTSAKSKRADIPTLLTGVIHCDCCGSAMTLATGKSGRYKHYKCCRKMAISPSACSTPNVRKRSLTGVLPHSVERLDNRP